MSDAKVVEEAVATRKGVRTAGTGHVVFSEEETAALLTALAEPFDPSIVKWKVAATRKRNGGFVQGQVLAYVDPRATRTASTNCSHPAAGHAGIGCRLFRTLSARVETRRAQSEQRLWSCVRS